jgi:hypothetical protein
VQSDAALDAELDTMLATLREMSSD